MATSKKKVATKIEEKQEKAPEETSQKKPAKKLAKQPETMEELLAMTGYNLKGVKKGDVVEGVIARVLPKEITIEIGGKTEGVVIDRELENYRDMLMALKPGDKVVAQVIVAVVVVTLKKFTDEIKGTLVVDKLPVIFVVIGVGLLVLL